jgi:hypothetical protein
MTGDKNAVWIATRDNRLIYCWWPQDPSRLDEAGELSATGSFQGGPFAVTPETICLIP